MGPAINPSVCLSYPRVAEAARDAGWEFMGHSYVQKSLHAVPDQREVIRKSVETLRQFTVRPRRGWLGPGLTETWETLDLLAEADPRRAPSHRASPDARRGAPQKDGKTVASTGLGRLVNVPSPNWPYGLYPQHQGDPSCRRAHV